jgi:hypothetical protein
LALTPTSRPSFSIDNPAASRARLSRSPTMSDSLVYKSNQFVPDYKPFSHQLSTETMITFSFLLPFGRWVSRSGSRSNSA